MMRNICVIDIAIVKHVGIENSVVVHIRVSDLKSMITWNVEVLGTIHLWLALSCLDTPSTSSSLSDPKPIFRLLRVRLKIECHFRAVCVFVLWIRTGIREKPDWTGRCVSYGRKSLYSWM